MTTQEASRGKVIGNVGNLDIRTATDEAVAEIRRIGNVGIVIYSPKTAHLLTQLNIGNMGSAVEVPEDAKLISGQLEISRDFFMNQSEPQSLAVVGQLLIHPDVAAADIENGLDKLVVCGHILCPEPLVGAIQSKIVDLTGRMTVYGEATKFAVGKVTLDENYLNALDDDTELLLIGKIDAPGVLDNDLLARKIHKLEVIGKIQCREENLTALRSVLDEKGGTTTISAIPAGFEPVAGRIDLDSTTLAALPGRKLYCSGLVQIDPEVDPAALDEAIDELQITSLLVCPAPLKVAVAGKCNLLITKAVFYEGELWLIDDYTELQASRFDYLDGEATLVVRDTLKIDPDIDAKILADRLLKVHNLDTILCTPEQMGALQARMGLNEGSLVDSTRERDEEEQEEGIGNVGNLRL